MIHLLLGGVLNELVFDGTFTGNKHHRCSMLFSLTKAAYDDRETNVRITQLDVSKFAKSQPNFHCFAAKAAETRHLLPAMLD